jgi:hypothetical protein
VGVKPEQVLVPGSGGSDYASVEAFCLFIGYPRSGHSLVGSLLDAHPDVVIAHEEGALRLVAGGAARDELFDRLIANARHQAERPNGRRASGYSYAIEGQWQGRARRLRVIGDKQGQKTTSLVGRNPLQLDDLQRTVRVPLRLLHVTRNPFDVVAQIALSSRPDSRRASLHGAASFLARLARVNQSVIEGPHHVWTVRHESFVRAPQLELRRICEFLGVEGDDPYLDACSQIVFDAPQQTRGLVEWTAGDVEAVEQVIARHEFFAAYSLTSVD